MRAKNTHRSVKKGRQTLVFILVLLRKSCLKSLLQKEPCHYKSPVSSRSGGGMLYHWVNTHNQNGNTTEPPCAQTKTKHLRELEIKSFIIPRTCLTAVFSSPVSITTRISILMPKERQDTPSPSHPHPTKEGGEPFYQKKEGLSIGGREGTTHR